MIPATNSVPNIPPIVKMFTFKKVLSKYNNIDFNDKNSKNGVNSPYIVYLFFGELISTKRGHYRFLQDIQDLQTLQIL
jgi:L-rhamnose isomerase